MLQNISSFSTNSAVQCKLAHATLRHTRASNARHHTPTYRHALHKYAPLPPPPPCPPPPHHTQRKPREERRRSAMKEGGDEDDEASMDFDFTQAASMVRSQLSTSVGVRVKCAHLESETGRTLNGLEGTIIGVGTPDECAAAVNGGPPFRVNVRVDGKGIRKPSRLPIFFIFFCMYTYIYIFFFWHPHLHPQRDNVCIKARTLPVRVSCVVYYISPPPSGSAACAYNTGCADSTAAQSRRLGCREYANDYAHGVQLWMFPGGWRGGRQETSNVESSSSKLPLGGDVPLGLVRVCIRVAG